jgi:predicted pyridoxine 5'-phosphate oxidase superfamily flavin-nucleotide-binding protein
MMQETTGNLAKAMDLAARTGYTLLAAVDETGTPRFTPVEQCAAAGEGRVLIEAWIDVPPRPGRCDGNRLALLVWDGKSRGYQLLGQAVRSRPTAVLDGVAKIEQEVHFPQVERTILMQVDSVEEFHFTPTPSPSDV